MATKVKKNFSIASLDASKLKDVDAPKVKGGDIQTYPERDSKDIPLGCLPAVSFEKGSIKKSTLTYENVYIVDALGKKVPATVQLTEYVKLTITVIPNELLRPGTKYSFNFSNKLRGEDGKKIASMDNSISFTTAKG